MDGMQLKQLIQQYLQETKVMQLATVSEGKPWVCNVWFAADENMNIYWISSVNRRHSKDLASNPHVAGAVCLPQAPEEKQRGLQFEGVAEMLTSQADVQKAMGCYVDRIFSKEKLEGFLNHPERPHKFYRVKPSLFVLLDAANFPGNPRQEYVPNQGQ
jgi:uncharacterized protein YhbP (UPF0306 family)